MYYSRDADIAAAMKQVIDKYEDRLAYHQKVVAYLDILVAYLVGHPTELEIDVFGTNPPMVLMPWQNCAPGKSICKTIFDIRCTLVVRI